MGRFYNKKKSKHYQNEQNLKYNLIQASLYELPKNGLDGLDPETKEKYQSFVASSFDNNAFIVENVAEDNACFFRAISNGLKNIVDTDGNSGGDVLYSIGRWKGTINYQDTYRLTGWGYYGSEQTSLAKRIQQIARVWIVKNAECSVNNIPGYRVIDMVRDLHEINIEDDQLLIAFYDACYSKFAGTKPRNKKQLSFDDSDDELNDSSYKPRFGKLTKKTQPPEMDLEEDNPFQGHCAIESDSDSYEGITDYTNEPSEKTIINTDDDYKNATEEIDTDEPKRKIQESQDDIDTDDEFGYSIGGTVSDMHQHYKQEILKSKSITKWDKWGSGVEAYALSQTFQVPIIVYEAKRFNFKTNKIENGRLVQGTKPDKNVRFKVTQIWGNEFQNSAPPIELLYKKVKNNIEHYMILYRNNQ